MKYLLHSIILLLLSTWHVHAANNIVRDYSWLKSLLVRSRQQMHTSFLPGIMGKIPSRLYQQICLLQTRTTINSTKLLLYGPPGNGKTSLAHALAKSIDAEMIVLKGSLIVGSYVNQGAITLQKIFEEIHEKLQRDSSYVLLFIDEVDQIARKNTHEMRSEQDAAIHTLWMLLDELKDNPQFIFIGATNSFELLDPAFVDRFGSCCIEINNPDEETRMYVFKEFFANIDYVLPDDLTRALVQKSKGLSIRSIEDLVSGVYQQSLLYGVLISESMIWQELSSIQKRNKKLSKQSRVDQEGWQALSVKTSILATILGSIISVLYLTEKTITYLHLRGVL